MITLQFDIDPVAKGRPRIGRGGHAYTPCKTRNFENAVKLLARSKFKAEPISGPVALQVLFFMKSPKRPTRRFPAVKPDLDNLLKCLTDALNGIVWKDDGQIVEVKAWKLYAYTGDQPHIQLKVEEIAHG